MKKTLVILLLLFSFVLNAQVGGRMKERKNQKRFLNHIAKSGWHYKKTSPGKLQNNWREGRFLYKGNVTSNKRLKRKLQGKINSERARKRIRGNDVFYKKKYNR
jgi:hypothetical protein